MPTKELPVAQLKAELFKALAHPMRIRALEQLAEGENSVGELATRLDVEISHLSQQLAVLRKVGVVTTRREGTTVYYSVADARFVALLAIARALLIDSLQNSQAVLDTLQRETGKRS